MNTINKFLHNSYIDVDKQGVGDNYKTVSFLCCTFDHSTIDNDNTCWKATAANILAHYGFNPRLNYPEDLADYTQNISKSSKESNAYDIYYLLINSDKLNINDGYYSGWTEDAIRNFSIVFSQDNIDLGIFIKYPKVNYFNNTYTYNLADYNVEQNIFRPKVPYYEDNLIHNLNSILEGSNCCCLSITWTKYNSFYDTYQVNQYSGHALTLWKIDETNAKLIITDSDSDPSNIIKEADNYDYFVNTDPEKYVGKGLYFTYNNSLVFVKYICYIELTTH